MGLRTVCEPCARSIDRWNLTFLIVKIAFWSGLIIMFLRLCHTSEGGNQTAVPNAPPASAATVIPAPRGTITDCLNTTTTASERAVCAARFRGEN